MDEMQQASEAELLEVTGGGPCTGFVGCVGYIAEGAGYLIGEGIVAIGEAAKGFYCYFAC